MAEKAPNEAEEEAGRESFLDQFLRRLEQTDQEATASSSTSGSNSMVAPSSEYPNPWFVPSATPSSPLNPDLAGLYARSSGPPSYLLANPLAEFPWLLDDQFDSHHRGDHSRLLSEPDSHDHRGPARYSSQYNPMSVSVSHGGYTLGSAGVGTSSQSVRASREAMKEELASSHTSAGSPRPGSGARKGEQIQGHGSSPIMVSHGSGSKLDHAGPVPRFERTMSGSEERSILSPARAPGAGGSSQSPLASRQITYRPPSSPSLLSEAVGGSVTTSAGTSNTSLSSESTGNAGDEDEGDKKEVSTAARNEGASSGKRKKPAAGGEQGGEGGEEGGEAGESKKAEPKNKPRKRGGAKRLREPRYAIKTRTDVDVLDDGFKWRKYGQKAVKNSPHPRNYYRCTTPLCPVRKRVERSNEDAGLVITTYEGTHTHQTPGFHRPSGGFFGDRPLVGGGLFQSPLGPNSSLLPLPPGFDLASLHRNIRGLQPNQNFPGSNPQQQPIPTQARAPFGFGHDSIFRAQQFLGLQDPSFGSSHVKQEPFQFAAQAPADHFMSRNVTANLPQLPRQPFEHPGAAGPSQALDRGPPTSNPLFTGLNFPSLPAGSPASSSSVGPTRDAIDMGQPRRDPVVGGGLETLVSGQPSFDQAQSVDAPQPGRSISGSHSLGSGLDQLTRRATSTPGLQVAQQQTRSGAGGMSSSSSEHAAPEKLLQAEGGVREGLLQDMVRHGGPKVGKS